MHNNANKPILVKNLIQKTNLFPIFDILYEKKPQLSY